MMMPEALIIHRFEHDQAKRERFGKIADYPNGDNLTDQWREALSALTAEQRAMINPIIHRNRFTDSDINIDDPAVLEVLHFYQT